jgi:hypothetical protein
MQTFLPLADLWDAPRCLDNRRLFKQGLEVSQLLSVLAGETTGWKAHPCVQMWRGHEAMLIDYGASCCIEWARRGYRATLYDRIVAYGARFPVVPGYYHPAWWGNEAVHAAHRAVLLRKGWEDALWAQWRAQRATLTMDGLPARKAQMRPHHYALLVQQFPTAPNHYAQFGWREQMAIPNAQGSYPYVWPV